MFWFCKVLALQRFARDRPHQDPHSRQMPQDLRLSGSDVLVLSVDNWKVGFAGCGSFPIKNKFGDVLVQVNVMGITGYWSQCHVFPGQ